MTPHVVRRLKTLRQLDHDAVHAYHRAIERVDVVAVRIALDSLRRDHERHVFELTRLLLDDGEPASDLRRSWKGLAREVRTAVRSVTGTRGALEAIHQIERKSVAALDDLLDEELPAGVRAMLEHDRDDEARHLRYLELALQLLGDDTHGPTRWERLTATL
jgi:rubrerythrin